MKLDSAQRLVIKIGSSLFLDEATGEVRAAWLKSVAEDIRALKKSGKECILVSSGAIALGRRKLGQTAKSRVKLEEKQALAALGQPQLMQHWQEALAPLPAAQVLLTADDSIDRRRYLNARGTLEELLAMGAVPIINENDTVATAEIKFGDNDRLAARVAEMISADALVLLSDVDGLYSENPSINPQAKHIPEAGEITPEIEAMAGGSASDHGSGGMITKLAAAKIALAAGCHMVITKGATSHPLQALSKDARATWFIAEESPLSARKKWIAGTLHPAGAVIVDDGAAEALRSGKSLLPAGVKALEGDFERGDAVLILDLKRKRLGRGLAAYSARNTLRILGRQSNEIETILGYKGRSALIHRDDMVLE